MSEHERAVSAEQTSDNAPVAAGDGPEPSGDGARMLAALGYLFVPFAVLGLFLPPYSSDAFVRLHAKQAMVLWASALLAALLPCLNTMLVLIALAAAVFAATRAWAGEAFELPLVGTLARRFD